MRKIILTGASSGIGLETLQLLLDQKCWNICAISRRAPSVAGHYKYLSCDVSSLDHISLVTKALKSGGPVYGLINCAGAGYFARAEELPVDEWNRILSINLTAPFLLTQCVLPGMKLQRSGRIINISSDADAIGFPNGSAYCASKFGLRGFGDALRKELIGTGVTVTTISPGRVDTCFNGKVRGMRPLSLSAKDIANVIAMVLATDARCEIESVRLKSNLE